MDTELEKVYTQQKLLDKFVRGALTDGVLVLGQFDSAQSLHQNPEKNNSYFFLKNRKLIIFQIN